MTDREALAALLMAAHRKRIDYRGDIDWAGFAADLLKAGVTLRSEPDEGLRAALKWCLDYIEETDVRHPTMPPLAEPFLSQRIAEYRALAVKEPKP